MSILGGCKIQDLIKNNTYFTPWVPGSKAKPGAAQLANVSLCGACDM